METRKLADVFKTVGLPPYTYVKPPYFGEVRSDIEQPGKHLLIEGPSGIGKTCIVFKVFEEIGWRETAQFDYISGRDLNAVTRIRNFISLSKGIDLPTPAVLVIDDFHILPESLRSEAGSDLKRVSDRAFEHAFRPK